MGSRSGVLSGMYIIVVEDNSDSREILRMLLEYFGARVTAVATAGEALTFLTAIDPTVVVVDMLLGRTERDDGSRLLREARKRGSKAPFIAVSGKDFDDAILLGAGFAAFLRKPLDHEQLVDTILAIVPTG